jgi:hypothetical protein
MKLRKEVSREPTSVSFDPLYEPNTFLSKYNLVELSNTFGLFTSSFELLKEEEYEEFLEHSDYIYCSIFNRIFKNRNNIYFFNFK